MPSRSSTTALVAAALLLVATTASAQALPASSTVAAPAAPSVGDTAPDFTASYADAAGLKDTPLTLSSLRGKVVVLAFYPLDRSGGCTAELIKFRDEHTALFGRDVVVLPISVDSASTHASWAAEMKFPFPLLSDPTLAIAAKYGSATPGRAYSNRTVFVIGKDGRIVWRDLRFNALAQSPYSDMAAAVAGAR